MSLLMLTLQRLNVIGTFRELGTNQQRRETLIALASTQMLVQLSSMPIAMTIPSVARQFNVDVSHAAWIVIIRLLMLGSTVFLAARLGEKYGHVRVYFIGAILMCVASVLSASALSLNQLILWSGLVGIGGALITANSNAILAMVFGVQERGRAFSVPVVAARIGAFIGLALFGVFLQYFSWRLVFLTSLPIGLLAIKNSYPLLKYQAQQIVEGARDIPINYVGAVLMVATLGAFILSGIHVHDGAESFSSPDAISYHVPMHLLFLSLLALFIVIQSRSRDPFVDFRYFKKKYFSTALYTNTTFHLSMLAVTTLVPIVVENGLGQPPIVVTLVLLPNQIMGLFLPTLAGWVYDRYNPRWLRPSSLMSIAVGFLLVGFFAGDVPVWGIPVLLLPAYIGSNLFNTANNAVVMNTLQENRSFASGMLETTRQMGHTLGVTIGATMLGLALPLAIEVLPIGEAQALYREGFRFSALAVVWIMISGGIVAMFQQIPQGIRSRRSAEPVPQASGGDG
jgi:MFS transporter, DHA2 family, methylenomycin A resistance protein